MTDLKTWLGEVGAQHFDIVSAHHSKGGLAWGFLYYNAHLGWQICGGCRLGYETTGIEIIDSLILYRPEWPVRIAEFGGQVFGEENPFPCLKLRKLGTWTKEVEKQSVEKFVEKWFPTEQRIREIVKEEVTDIIRREVNEQLFQKWKNSL